MQIKTISEWQWADVFQEKVNEWLEEHTHYNILDVKYSTAYHQVFGKILFSAIVVYNKN